MRKVFTIVSLCFCIVISIAFNEQPGDDLRKIYSRDPSTWPAPAIDEGVTWTELGVSPASPVDSLNDSVRKIVSLGRALFFDTRLSGSGTISCATCHQPALNWTDGRARSLGHEGALTKRNSPTIQNAWFYKKLFWDGRAKDLQDQAFAPINSETEMHSEMHEVMMSLRRLKEYKTQFKEAFGDEGIDPDRMTYAIAIFEKTIVNGPNRFDNFLKGDVNALSTDELKGLHLFRTKARCMNCHNGPLFTDNSFHNNGFHLNNDPSNDKGLSAITRQESDLGKFKTPSLRDVTLTGPWMHNGVETSLAAIIDRYNKPASIKNLDSHIKTLGLSKKEKKQLLAFLKCISGESETVSRSGR